MQMMYLRLWLIDLFFVFITKICYNKITKKDKKEIKKMEFTVGKKIQHKFTKDYLWVLRVGNEQILCRTKDLREVWFYTFELEEIK